MRLGLLADVHEAVELLDLAIVALRGRGVDRFVCLGDVFETGPRLAEAVDRLERAGAVGVWGNHDFGLCVDPAEETLSRYPGPTLDYLATFRGALTLGGCRFAHIEPWLDPTAIEDLWHLEVDRPFEAEVTDGLPTMPPGSRSFMGHKHRWLAARGPTILPWRGDRPVDLGGAGPWLVVVHAVVDGWCALYDTESMALEPIRLPGGPAAGD